MDNNIIPVIGVPTVNGGEWLKRFIESIDYNVDTLVIWNNNGRGLITDELNEFAQINYKWIRNIEVCHLPSNMGVSSTWNLTIKNYIMAPYWLISNDDIAFTPGLLETIHKKTLDKSIDMVHASDGHIRGTGSYDLFTIKESVVRKIGLFDENLFPAYYEDHEYTLRCLRWSFDNPTDAIYHTVLNASYYHGDALSTDPLYSRSNWSARQTSRSDSGDIKASKMWERINNSFKLNENYLREKWGEEFMKRPQDNIMGIKDIPIDYTRYDIDFVRSKYLGF
tara:strand:+ start:674 stop:1513 length:840 start_codon:yes stop_codon:yes gene_type:complete